MEKEKNLLKLYLGLGVLAIIFVAVVAVMFVRAYRATMPRNGNLEERLHDNATD